MGEGVLNPLAISLLFLLVLHGCTCVTWTGGALPDGKELYACKDGTLVLNWDLDVAAGDNIHIIEWFYKGISDLLVGTWSPSFSAAHPDGYFNPTPSYVGRVNKTGHAGLVISNLTLGEAGQYSVLVNGHSSEGREIRLNRSVTVMVGDGLMTTDGHLTASQKPTAMFDDADQAFHVVLACAKFVYGPNPPISLKWTTPSGDVLNSSSYSAGEFLLQLANPVVGGFYTCTIPPAAAAKACLHGSASASIRVDPVLARLSLLEAENNRLKQDANEMKDDDKRLKNETQVVKEELEEKIRLLEEKDKLLADQDVQLKQQDALLTNRAAQLETEFNTFVTDFKTRRVSFYARNSKSWGGNSRVLVFTDVDINIGNGYSSSTGVFKAPYSGVYAFMATMSSYGDADQIFLYQIEVNGSTRLGYREEFAKNNHDTISPMTALLRLSVGDTVGIRLPSSGNYHVCYNNKGCSFSGVLINAE